MSDWDFLHDMHDQGYSPEAIADAAAVGYAPWERVYLSKEWIESELEDESSDDASSLRPRQQFRSRDGFPYSAFEQFKIFEDLIHCADRHFKNTGRYGLHFGSF